MNQFGYKPSYERNLPHIQPPVATLFVTFRLDGSIPEPVLEQWRTEKKRLEMTMMRWAAISQPGTIPNPDEVAEEKLRFHLAPLRRSDIYQSGANWTVCATGADALPFGDRTYIKAAQTGQFALQLSKGET